MIRAENFRMVDIEINAWSSLLFNLETKLILYLYPEKFIKFNQSESSIRSRSISNFRRHLRLTYRNGRDSIILKNRFLIFLYFILYFFLCPHWIFGLSSRDQRYPILKFPAQVPSKNNPLRKCIKIIEI